MNRRTAHAAVPGRREGDGQAGGRGRADGEVGVAVGLARWRRKRDRLVRERDERQVVEPAGRDRTHARETGRDAALATVVRAAAAAPDDDGAVAPQREALIGARRDRGHAREVGRHAALPGRVRAAAPGDHGAVAPQRQAVVLAGGDGRDRCEAGRDVALAPVPAALAAPGDDPARRACLGGAGRKEQHRRADDGHRTEPAHEAIVGLREAAYKSRPRITRSAAPRPGPPHRDA